MTIALGVLAKDTVVIAADTQETYAGILKVNQGKILATFNGPDDRPSGAMAVTGAGSSVQLDSLQQTLCDVFNRSDPKTIGEAGALVQKILPEFHAKHVAPFSTWPEYDRPSCSMVIGVMVRGRRELAITDKTAVSLQPYGAVGIGAAQANLLLGRLWEPERSWQAAVMLAAYVMFHVKQLVEGCGKDTQIVVVKDDRAFVIEVERVERLEREFKEYAVAEDRAVRHMLGLGPTRPPGGPSRFRPDFARLRKKLRAILAEELEHTDSKRSSIPRWVGEHQQRRGPKR